MWRLFLEAAHHRAGGRECAVVHRDRRPEDRGVVVGSECEVAVYRHVSIDEVAECTTGADRLPFQKLEVGGRTMEGNRIEAVASPGVAADRPAEIGLADAVEVNRRVRSWICHAAGAATGNGLRLQGPVVCRL